VFEKRGIFITIDILCVGKIKEKYFSDAIDEYLKRLKRFAKVNIFQVADEKIPDNSSDKLDEQIKTTECKKMIEKLKPGFTIAMCVEGKQLSSPELADKISSAMQSNSHITFIIGGSLGLSEEIKSMADLRLSIGKITLPHQLMRVVLLEQIYRAFKINANETYHK